MLLKYFNFSAYYNAIALYCKDSCAKVEHVELLANGLQDNPETEIRYSKWWMGGVAASAASCFTQSLDTIKVHQQTHKGKHVSIYNLTANVIKQDGLLALNHGLSAAVLRQLTYSTVRFAFYEAVKQNALLGGGNMPFYEKVIIAGIGGALGGVIGTPADVINVRMQNDIKLPHTKRRNYQHVFNGLWRVYKEEGFMRLFSGFGAATGRSVMMTIGQLSFYDLSKDHLMNYGFRDNSTTHFLASLIASGVATVLTQPLDVIKTKLQNAKPGEFKTRWNVISYTATLGPVGFYRGFWLRFIRLGPQTILTFIFFEQLRLNFGFTRVSTV